MKKNYIDSFQSRSGWPDCDETIDVWHCLLDVYTKFQIDIKACW